MNVFKGYKYDDPYYPPNDLGDFNLFQLRNINEYKKISENML